MTTDYERFLAGKMVTAPAVGFEVAESDLNPALFEWQRKVTAWTCRRGWAAVFADCGLGKSLIQLEWCRQVFERTRKPVLMVAPLGVTMQLRREGEKFGIPIKLLRNAWDELAEVNVTNWERLERFSPDRFGGIDLDESSILKSFGGKTAGQLTRWAHSVPYRLAATATPSPNDCIELTNHSAFLGIRTAKEATGEFFRTVGNSSNTWELKKHAKSAFYDWLATWAVALRTPSELGYADDGYILPPIHHHSHLVDSPLPSDGTLFQAEARGLTEQRRVNRATITERVAAMAELALSHNEPWLIWCHLNPEGEALKRAIPGAVEVTGSDDQETKERGLLGFADGSHRVLITKPSIAGHGMNYQHCARMGFVGLNNSYEDIYQAKRRCWRFGQQREVHIHIVTTDADGPVTRNIQRKEVQATEMMDELVSRMGDLSGVSAKRETMDYQPVRPMTAPAWLVSAG